VHLRFDARFNISVLPGGEFVTCFHILIGWKITNISQLMGTRGVGSDAVLLLPNSLKYVPQ